MFSSWHLQVQDAASRDAQNQRDFETAQVNVGQDRFGHYSDCFGHDGDAVLGSSAQLPLLNMQVTVENREQILEALPLGVKVSICLQRQKNSITMSECSEQALSFGSARTFKAQVCYNISWLVSIS